MNKPLGYCAKLSQIIGVITFFLIMIISLVSCGAPIAVEELKLEGFAADFEKYNLFFLPLDDNTDSKTVNDVSPYNRIGMVIGDVQLGSSARVNSGAILNGGYIQIDVGNMPEAFAFDAWVRLDRLDEKATIVSQDGNFELNAVWASDFDRNPPQGIYLVLNIFNANTGNYEIMAETYYDEELDLKLGNWQHIVAIYDGHFKGRIYVNDILNEEGISRFEGNLNQLHDYTKDNNWPRQVSTQTAPVILGAQISGNNTLNAMQGALDMIRFSDITHFRVNFSNQCPPNCRPGDHGITGLYNFYHHPCAGATYFANPPANVDPISWGDHIFNASWQYYLWHPAYMHTKIFNYRMPYVQNVTDHSALVVWRRQCEITGLDVDWSRPELGCNHAAMQFCYGEAGKGFSECEMIYPKILSNDYSTAEDPIVGGNYPDCQYTYELKDLRPSTWYHYKISETSGEEINGQCGGTPKPILYTIEPLKDSNGNPVDWAFAECVPTGFMTQELASDAHFQTAPLALDDQIELLAFGDTGPLVCGPAAVFANELRACYWLSNLVAGHEPVWGTAVPNAINELTFSANEMPSLWLAPGDIAQTKYNDHTYEAYLFGLFNRVWWYSYEKPTGFYNGFMEGVPLYAAIGNHEWGASGYGEEENQCKYSASEYTDNLFPPNRQFDGEMNQEFMYKNSSYSFDFGNLHIVSISGSCATSFIKSANEAWPRVIDQVLYMGDWNRSNSFDAWKERYTTGEDSLQMIWLKRDLWNYKNDPSIWKIIMFHVPLTESDVGDMRYRLARFFEVADVDLILVGHSHKFERATTERLTELSGQSPIPDNEHTTQLIVGTGGYVADIDAGGAIAATWFADDQFPEKVGPVRIFVDGNMMFTVFHDLKNPDYIFTCVQIKGNNLINKSECLAPSSFSYEACNGKDEGATCGVTESGLGRCLKPHSLDPNIGWGVPEHPELGPSPLRCIPNPSKNLP